MFEPKPRKLGHSETCETCKEADSPYGLCYTGYRRWVAWSARKAAS